MLKLFNIGKMSVKINDPARPSSIKKTQKGVQRSISLNKENQNFDPTREENETNHKLMPITDHEIIDNEFHRPFQQV